MLRTVGDQPTLWESLLPPEALVMPAELERVDRLLDDVRFFAPFASSFHATLGRPSIPIETYLRLMFLKYRYRLGFETLCREVTDSITWQRFCRIPLGGRVPHPSTLMKITTRCGQPAVDALNEALLAKAHEAKVLKMNRLRADTTVVEADIKYPTDSGLLTAATCRIASRLRRLARLGVKIAYTDRTAAARAHQHSIGAWLRRRSDEAKAEVLVITGRLADLAEASVVEATKAYAIQGSPAAGASPA